MSGSPAIIPGLVQNEEALQIHEDVEVTLALGLLIVG